MAIHGLTMNRKFPKIPIKSFQYIILCLLSVVVALWVSSCASSPSQVIILRIGGAGMVRNPMEEIETLYQQKKPNVVINSIFGGSSIIRKTIEQGEPFDGVIFSEELSLNQLEAKGLILPKSRKKILTSDLVLIALADSPLQVSSFKELADDRIKSVAIGNKSVAISLYSDDLLTNLGIEEIVKSKAFFTTGDVRNVLRAVEQGDAEVGITFLAEAKGSSKVKILATAPKNLYQQIRGVYAIIKTSAYPQEIEEFFKFLSSDQAMAVFKKFGIYPLS